MKKSTRRTLGIIFFTLFAVGAFGLLYYEGGWPEVIWHLVAMLICIPLIFLINWFFD
jgi:hypothetical protein